MQYLGKLFQALAKPLSKTFQKYLPQGALQKENDQLLS